MFKNSGKKIMGFAKFIYVMNLILAILAVAGGCLFVVMEYGDEVDLWLPYVGLVVLAGALYMLLVYVSVLGLYAFGELVQSNIDMQRSMDELQLSMARLPQQLRANAVSRQEPAPAAPVAPVPPVPRAPAQEYTPEPRGVAPIVEDDFYFPESQEDRPVTYAYNYKAPAGAPAYPMQSSAVRMEPEAQNPAPGVVLCSKCGGKHDPSATFCRYCGTPLH